MIDTCSDAITENHYHHRRQSPAVVTGGSHRRQSRVAITDRRNEMFNLPRRRLSSRLNHYGLLHENYFKTIFVIAITTKHSLSLQLPGLGVTTTHSPIKANIASITVHPSFHWSICSSVPFLLGSGPEGDVVLSNTGRIFVLPSVRLNERTEE